MRLGAESTAEHIPDSEHGLNWANVHKRLIPQLIRKGNVAASAPRCRGLFFVIPDIVYRKFEEVVGAIEALEASGRYNLTVMTYNLGLERHSGQIRPLRHVRTVHYDLENVAASFVAKKDPNVGIRLDRFVAELLGS
jgi:hypothetical protein